MNHFISFLFGFVVGSFLYAVSLDTFEKDLQKCEYKEDPKMVFEMKLNVDLIKYKYQYKELHGVEPPIDSIRNWIDTHICRDSLLLLQCTYNEENEHIYVDRMITLP